MTTPQTRSLLVENIFWILTYNFTLMKLMNVTRPSKKKIQCLVKLNNSTTARARVRACVWVSNMNDGKKNISEQSNSIGQIYNS
jgi:hypothetical protein